MKKYFYLDTFRFSLARDTQALFEIPFTKYLDNTDTQKVIRFNRVKDCGKLNENEIS